MQLETHKHGFGIVVAQAQQEAGGPPPYSISVPFVLMVSMLICFLPL
jgi:hypothetical protein